METPTAIPTITNPTPTAERIYIVNCAEHTSDALVPLRVFFTLDEAKADIPTFTRIENLSLATFNGDLSEATGGVLAGDLWGTVDEIWAFYEDGSDKPEYVIVGGYLVRRAGDGA
jgi:hypothetical protein